MITIRDSTISDNRLGIENLNDGTEFFGTVGFKNTILVVKPKGSTNEDLSQDTPQDTSEEGIEITVPNKSGYTDGILKPEEKAKVQFAVCLKTDVSFDLLTHVTHKSGNIIKYKWLVQGTSPIFRDNSW